MSSTLSPSTDPASAAGALALVAAGSLETLARALTARLGDEGAEYLRDAGFATGAALAKLLMEERERRNSPPPGEMTISEFGVAVEHLFREAGWGRLSLDSSRTSITVIEVHDWSERWVGAHFTTGLLAGFFGAIAGEPLSVLVVDGAHRLEDGARFLMGSVATIDSLYSRLEGGGTVEDVLAAVATAAA